MDEIDEQFTKINIDLNGVNKSIHDIFSSRDDLKAYEFNYEIFCLISVVTDFNNMAIDGIELIYNTVETTRLDKFRSFLTKLEYLYISIPIMFPNLKLDSYDSNYEHGSGGPSVRKLSLYNLMFWEIMRLYYICYFPIRHELLIQSKDVILQMNLIGKITITSEATNTTKQKSQSILLNKTNMTNTKTTKEDRFWLLDKDRECCRNLSQLDTSFHVFCSNWTLYPCITGAESYIKALHGMLGFWFVYSLPKRLYDNNTFAYNVIDEDGVDYTRAPIKNNSTEHEYIPSDKYLLKSQTRYTDIMELLNFVTIKPESIRSFSQESKNERVAYWSGIIHDWCHNNIRDLEVSIKAALREYIFKKHVPVGHTEWFSICNPNMTATADSIFDQMMRAKIPFLNKLSMLPIMSLLGNMEYKTLTIIKEYVIILAVGYMLGTVLLTESIVTCDQFKKKGKIDQILSEDFPLFIVVCGNHVVYWHKKYADIQIYDDIYSMIALWICCIREKLREKVVKLEKHESNEKRLEKIRYLCDTIDTIERRGNGPDIHMKVAEDLNEELGAYIEKNSTRYGATDDSHDVRGKGYETQIFRIKE